MAMMEKLQTGKNFVVYQSDDRKLIKIENVRISHPYFGAMKASESDDGTAKLSRNGVALLSKTSHLAAKDAFMALVKELETVNKAKIPSEYRCIKDGDETDDEVKQGQWVINFSDNGKNRPPVRTVDGEVMSDAEEIDEKFYGGCWVSVLLRPWFFGGKAKNSTKTFPKRVCCGYNGVQFLRDDKRFGAGAIDDTDVWGSAKSGNAGDDDDDDGL